MGWPRGGPRQLCIGRSHYEHNLALLQRWSEDLSSQRLKEERGGQPLLSEPGKRASEAAPTLWQFVTYQHFRDAHGVS